MGIKRVIDVNFWNDDKVMDMFTPEDKLFMLYLLTNPHTTQLGVYSINKKNMAFELGYSIETINVLIDRFQNKYKICKYSEDTKEIAIKNYLKHSIVKGGKPVEDLLKKEINQVKDKTLLSFIYNNIKDYENLNETVKNILNLLYNDNDNDNDVSYHDTYHDTLKSDNKGKNSNSLVDDFELIWKEYPKKEGKSKAFSYYKGFINGTKEYCGKKIKLTNKQMWLAVKEYADECEEQKRDMQYIKMGSTFFNSSIVEYVEKVEKDGNI